MICFLIEVVNLFVFFFLIYNFKFVKFFFFFYFKAFKFF